MAIRHKDISEILITPSQIQARVKELGREITNDYKGRDVVLVGILKGCFVFISDLVKNIDLDMAIDFMMISSYDGERQSSGVVRILLDLRQPVENKDVIIVEDIVDSGLTINYLIKAMKARRPKSVEVCTLLNKPSCRKINVKLRYVGFEIPDKFVVGYGLDYKEYYRNLPYIGILKDEVI